MHLNQNMQQLGSLPHERHGGKIYTKGAKGMSYTNVCDDNERGHEMVLNERTRFHKGNVKKSLP